MTKAGLDKQAVLERVCGPVSRETMATLLLYESLLKKWQKTINLVSPNTIPEAWQRHLVDSSRILPVLEGCVDDKSNLNKIRVFDFGSGAGFPAVVLKALRPALSISVVESDQRKCSFLRTVSRETKLEIDIFNRRLEALAPVIGVDFITARAFAPLEKIFEYSLSWFKTNPNLQLVLLKGESYKVELGVARERFSFDCVVKDRDDLGGVVLVVKNLVVG